MIAVSATEGFEIEIKLKLDDAGDGARRLSDAGFKVSHARTFERNDTFDTPDLAVRARGELIRLREFGARHILTFKGPEHDGPHKVREERETTVSEPAAIHRILESLGLKVVFRYEKFRTEYERAGEPGTATLDETPIGAFLELEGPAYWIDATAQELGFTLQDYVTLSYGALYKEHCRIHNLVPRDFVFSHSQ